MLRYFKRTLERLLLIPKATAIGVRTRSLAFGQAAKRLYHVGKPFWVSEKRWVAIGHLLLILVLLYANARVNVFISEATNHYITSIEQRSPDDVRNHYLMVCVLAVCAVTPISVFYGYFRTRLALVWRNWLSNDFFNGYFTNLAYYKLLNNKQLDNPDQRMSQDVDSFCNSSVGLFISFVDAAVQIYLWFGVLWAISPTLTLSVIGYAVGGTIVVMLIGRALVHITNTQMKTEGDLRRTLQEVGREAEAIAFYRGEEIAKIQSKSRLKAVIDNLFNMMNTYRNISFFTTTFNGLVPLIAPWFIGALYVADTAGGIKFGLITQGGMAVVGLVGALTLVMGQFGGFASFFAITARLGSLKEAIEACGMEQLPPDKRIKISEGPDIIFKKTSIIGHDLQKVYVKDLDFIVKAGESIIIVGADGVGKTEIMMVLAGMNNAGQGELQRPPFNEVMFLTQTPYLPASTLRQAVGYPCAELCLNDDDLLKALHFVNLGDLVTRCGGLDVEQNWREKLSLSEQQRLSLARIFFKKPRYAVIDEATSALEKETEKLVFGVLTGLGTTVISAANNDGLVQFHTWVMILPGDGTYKICKASEYKPTRES